MNFSKKMKKKSGWGAILLFALGAIIIAAMPLSAFAAFDDTKGLIAAALEIVNLLAKLAAGAALLFFFWGLAKFILRAGDETGREEGKKIMFWGIIALFVLVSIWGIVVYIADETGIMPSSPNFWWESL